jgi:hypothetical protein
VDNKLVFDSGVSCFNRAIGPTFSPGYNCVFEDCSATNMYIADWVSNEFKSPVHGFDLDIGVDVLGKNTDTATIYKNCSAQDVYGSETSAGFAIINSKYTNQTFTVIYENCTAQFDRIHNPDGYSNGFLTNNASNDVVWKRCIATGHNLNGFDLAGYSVDNSNGTGYAKFLIEDCIANANSGHGFELHNTLNGVEIINCKATNNGENGIHVNGRNLVLINNIADLNTENGISIESYFPFYAKVATNTDLSNLAIYTIGNPAGYNVQYFPDTLNGAGYLMFVPNDLSAPLPLYVPINGVQIKNGDIVLVKDETNATLNGVYQANNYGGVRTGPQTSTPVWKLVRVDPWRAPYIVLVGTKVLVEQSNAPNLSPGPIMYILQNDVQVDVDAPVFKPTNCIRPDKSRITIEDCNAVNNDVDGFHNNARDIIISNCNASRNKHNGFVDESIKGAQHNGNLYTKNKAYLNDECNYKVDYVKPSNSSVLQVGSINPPKFPTSDASEANVSIVKKLEKKCHKHH